MPGTDPEQLESVEEVKVFDQLEAVTVRTEFDAWINRIGKYLSVIIFVSMAISVFEVVCRYVFQSPTEWVHETTVLLIAIMFAFSGAFTFARGRHIQVRALYDSLTERNRRALDAVNALLALAYFIGLAYASWVMFDRSIFDPTGSFVLERSGSAWNPPHPPFIKAAVLIAAITMAIQAALHFMQNARRLLRPNPKPRNKVGGAKPWQLDFYRNSGSAAPRS